MLDWNVLPHHFRVDVVKSLDLRSRCRLRHVAKSVLEFVDSVPLFIQRVRLHEKDGNVMLHFYTDVRKSMSVELASGVRSEVYCILRLDASQNKPSFAKPVGSTSPILAAVTIFKSVAMHPNTVLGGLEIFFRAPEHTASIDKLLGEHTTIRARLLKYDYNLFVGMALIKRLVESDLREIQFVVEQPANTYALVQRVCYKYTVTENQLMKRMVTSIVDPSRDPAFVGSRCACYLRKKVTNAKADVMKYSRDGRINENAPGDFSTVFLSSDPPIMVRAHQQCGSMFYLKMDEIKEGKSNTVTCPMRYACPTHSDPFDYWYHMKRVADEYTYFTTPEFYDEEVVLVKNVKQLFAELMKNDEELEQELKTMPPVEKGKKKEENETEPEPVQGDYDLELRRHIKWLIHEHVFAKMNQSKQLMTFPEIREARRSILREKNRELKILLWHAENRRSQRLGIPPVAVSDHELKTRWARFIANDLVEIFGELEREEESSQRAELVEALAASDGWKQYERMVEAKIAEMEARTGRKLTPKQIEAVQLDLYTRNEAMIQKALAGVKAARRT